MKKICQVCGKEFEAKSSDKNSCSLRCKKIALKIASSPESGIRICKNCGKEYYYKKGQGNWLKNNNTGWEKSDVSSINFCCYECGKKI